MNRWLVAEPISKEVKEQFPDYHPALLQLLWNRGLRSKDEFEQFLHPDWERDVHDPWVFQNMRSAVDRVYEALENGEIITVHGDYDADGVCGSTVLVSTLREIVRKLGADESTITSFIPHREKDGYGVNPATIERLSEEGTTLLITVDCGISNKPAIDRGKELGMDTIVCDHHAMPEELPDNAILIHPQVPGEPYPNKVLCGTGVAFKLACGLIHEAQARGMDFPDGYEKWLLDLVAIATVTDVMPLTGENRALEHFGLKVLNKTRRVGLKKLIDVAGSKGELDTISIGFQLGPRINAAGRMEHAKYALELLAEEEEVSAIEKAQRLDSINRERQKASEAMYKEALKMVGDPAGKKLIVVMGEDWSPGLVGLVAGKLVSQFGIPTYAVGKVGEKFVGSGRSTEILDVTKAMHAASEHLDKFGGHPQACGFSTTGDERFQKAAAALEAYAEQEIVDTKIAPTFSIDAEISLDTIDFPLIEDIGRCAPFGEGNPQPLFLARNLSVHAFDTVGADGKHLRLTVNSPHGKLFKMIGFRFGERVSDLSLGAKIDVVFELGINEWNGRKEIQLKIEDIKIV